MSLWTEQPVGGCSLCMCRRSSDGTTRCVCRRKENWEPNLHDARAMEKSNSRLWRGPRRTSGRARGLMSTQLAAAPGCSDSDPFCVCRPTPNIPLHCFRTVEAMCSGRCRGWLTAGPCMGSAQQQLLAPRVSKQCRASAEGLAVPGYSQSPMSDSESSLQVAAQPELTIWTAPLHGCQWPSWECWCAAWKRSATLRVCTEHDLG